MMYDHGSTSDYSPYSIGRENVDSLTGPQYSDWRLSHVAFVVRHISAGGTGRCESRNIPSTSDGGECGRILSI